MKSTRHAAIWLALGLGFAVPVHAQVRAQDDTPTEEPVGLTLQERYDALEAQLQIEMDAFIEAYRAAYDAGKAETFELEHPLQKRFPDFVALADEGSLPAMMWVVQNYGNGADADLPRYLGDLLANDSKVELENVLLYLHYSVPLEQVDATLAKDVLEVLTAYSKRAETRFGVQAQIALARLLGGAPDNAAYVERSVGHYKALLANEAAAQWHKALQGELYVLTRLRIGLVAPDFVGMDVDGNEIKLSNHRGKVTVVEFWGFW